jgi:LuxR family transcriptional regulator, quorum-sensing system regulator SdiA
MSLEAAMLSTMIPNYDAEIVRLRELSPAGFTLAFNLTVRGPEHFHTEQPKAWRKYYEDRNLHFMDPILVWAIANTGNRRWSEVPLPDIKGVLVAARRYGLNYGAVISRKIDGKHSVLSLARKDRELTDTEMEVAAAKFDSFLDVVVGAPLLTDGELEVLRALKDGLGQAEIAARLAISESAVKLRCQKACAKLNARTRTQAVAIAVAKNLFEY